MLKIKQDMQIDLEKIIAHANERLATGGWAADHEERVDVFRRFLKVETERLKIRHRFGLGGGEIASGRSYVIDVVVCRACDLAATELVTSDVELNSFAVVALGGYGRMQLAPFSDVDILFLHGGKRSKGAKEFVEHVLYLLWDIGLTVGHCFRSVRDCVDMARTDLHSRNAMAEARLVIGNAPLFRRLARELDDSVFKSKRETDRFLETMRLEMEARYDKFGREVCLQEPNVKESAGGLRDLHTVLWVGHARYGSRGLDDLRAEDHISGAEYSTARRAYDFIMRVRNEAHFLAGRKMDLLTLDLQPKIASSLGYSPRRGLIASELLMIDYYQRAKELHQFSEAFLMRAIDMRPEKRRTRRAAPVRASFEMRKGSLYLSITRRAPTPTSASAGFEIKHGLLYMREKPFDFDSNPMRLVEVFSAAQSESVRLSTELKLAVRGNLSLVDRSFRASEEAGKAFMQMLGQRGRVGAALRLMHETGFLGRLLPEFGRITFLVQHDAYHKYTIDEHTLKATEALDRLACDDDDRLTPLRGVLAEITDAAPLYLALLLHDIGKGRGADHSARGAATARRVCARLGLDTQSAQDVIFLVRQHLLMSHLSQRRDLSDPDLVGQFASTVGDIGRLNMLLLLTYADTSGVGPAVWSDWKGTLLWELYSRARSQMAAGRAPTWDAGRKTEVVEQVIGKLRPDYLPSDVWKHLAMMPERYLRATEPDQMARHFRLVSRLGDQALAADWRIADQKHSTELIICARDRRGLFARIAGTLTAAGISILSAELYTREDGTVIDAFKLREVSGPHAVKPERWPKVEQSLKAAIEESLDVAAAVESRKARSGPRSRRQALRPVRPTVRFDSEASATSTVIEVRAEDEPGLAYKLAGALAAFGVNIVLARIATEKSHALDVFYVTDLMGRKLLPSDMSAVEAALVEALTPDSMKEKV